MPRTLTMFLRVFSDTLTEHSWCEQGSMAGHQRHAVPCAGVVVWKRSAVPPSQAAARSSEMEASRFVPDSGSIVTQILQTDTSAQQKGRQTRSWIPVIDMLRYFLARVSARTCSINHARLALHRTNCEHDFPEHSDRNQNM